MQPVEAVPYLWADTHFTHSTATVEKAVVGPSKKGKEGKYQKQLNTKKREKNLYKMLRSMITERERKKKRVFLYFTV